MFGSKALAHIPDEKRKALLLESEKCSFVGYYENVKGCRLIQHHSNEIIIRRDVKFDEGLSVDEPNSMVVSYLACKPSSTIVPSFISICFLMLLF